MRKIVIIGPAYPLRGGIATFTERLAQELKNCGDDISIETYSLQYPKLLFPGKTQFSTEKTISAIPIHVSLNSIHPLNWVKLGYRLKREKPDLIIFKFWIPFMAPALGTIARIVRKNKITKCIGLAHNVLPHEKRLGDRLLSNYFVKAMDAFLVLSESVKKDLEGFAYTKPIRMSPHPLYDHFGEGLSRSVALEMLGLDSAWNYVLFFGFIREYKGLDLALKAMASSKLKDLKVKLIVAGEFYSDSKPYFDLVDAFGIKDRVLFFSSFITDSQIPGYFAAADLIVQPYKNATQSGVTQVAYHFNKPILVTNVGGLPELVPHQKVGYVSGLDPEEIASNILDFYAHNRAKEFSENIKVYKKKYSWELFVEQFNKLVIDLEKTQ
ncbi:MAG: glycosyltransferase family 4 protein [Bacteroidales bacterium]|nr:glycosyltransferase family 4 protein [Bacteroidales bacterium]